MYDRERGRNVTIAGFEKQVSAAAGQDLRWFFGLWVDSTGVPEFAWDYSVLRTAAGGWRVRGTLRQSIEGLRMPVDVLVSSPGGDERLTLRFDGSKAADFVAEPKGGQPTLIVDPDRNILRSSDTIRVAVVVRRGIQEIEQNNYVEAESKLRDALKLAPRARGRLTTLAFSSSSRGIRRRQSTRSRRRSTGTSNRDGSRCGRTCSGAMPTMRSVSASGPWRNTTRPSRRGTTTTEPKPWR